MTTIFMSQFLSEFVLPVDDDRSERRMRRIVVVNYSAKVSAALCQDTKRTVPSDGDLLLNWKLAMVSGMMSRDFL